MSVTYYVALPFVRTEEGVAPGEAQEMPNEGAAIRRAESMSAGCCERRCACVQAERRSKYRKLRRRHNFENHSARCLRIWTSYRRSDKASGSSPKLS